MISVTNLFTTQNRVETGDYVVVNYQGEELVGKVNGANYKRNEYVITALSTRKDQDVVVCRKRHEIDKCAEYGHMDDLEYELLHSTNEVW